MKQKLIDLFKHTVVYKYDLPNKKIGKSILSSQNDMCYECLDSKTLAEIIYKSIIYYSFNELEIEQTDVKILLKRALEESIKFSSSANLKTQKSHGFYGEVLLYCFLITFFKANPIIARGYFYNPTAKSEITGYDSYHLIEQEGNVELWFGEAKMFMSYKKALDTVIPKIHKVLNDEYLNTNFVEISKKDKELHTKSPKIHTVISKWKKEGVNPISEIKQQNMKLVYPILIAADKKTSYDECIHEIIEYINSHKPQQITLSIPYSLFFIFLPVETVSLVKERVIQCIQNQIPLI